MIDTLSIVGVGLLGASVGLAARKRRLARHVLGVGRDPATLERAARRGAIDAACDLPEAARRSQFVVVCTPVETVAEHVLKIGLHCAAHTHITDVGSTKAAIVRSLDGKLPPGVAFVGSHPLAGSEKRGSEHAEADLFEGRLTVVTPGPTTPPDAVSRVVTFWEAVGSRVTIMDPEGHDRALALTSHLPHLAAAALAGILPAELHELTATGFRDTTRVAAGHPSLWTGIFAQNRAATLDALGRLCAQLEKYRVALENKDWAALDALLTQAKKVRDALAS
jgi:prephenate dehydrogenase